MERQTKTKNIEMLHKLNFIVLIFEFVAIGLMVLIGIATAIGKGDPTPLINLLYLLGVPGCCLGYYLLEVIIDKVEADERRTEILEEMSHKKEDKGEGIHF